MRTVLTFSDDEAYAAKVASNSMALANALDDINELCRDVIDGKVRLEVSDLAEEIKAITVEQLGKL
jgi:hypothetical protein